jgi:valyl-tRNA synthetase
MNLPDGDYPHPRDVKEKLSPQDRWILTRLQQVTDEAWAALAEYRFNDYAGGLYHFAWHEFCDWYVELAKVRLYGEDPAQKARAQATLTVVFGGLLRLLHPIMPFITEELWQTFGEGALGPLAVQAYPQVEAALDDPEAEGQMQTIIDAVTAARTIRADLRLKPGQPVALAIAAAAAQRSTLAANQAAVCMLTRASSVELLPPDAPKPAQAASAVVGGLEVHLLTEALGSGAAEELKRLEAQVAKLEADCARSDRKLANEEFMAKAPEAVIAKERARLAEAQEALEKLRARRGLLEEWG